MRTVALEEHYANPSFLDGPGRELKDQALKFGGPTAKLLEQLCEVGAMRIAEMDAAGIDMQALSLTSSRHRATRGRGCCGRCARSKRFPGR